MFGQPGVEPAQFRYRVKLSQYNSRLYIAIPVVYDIAIPIMYTMHEAIDD